MNKILIVTHWFYPDQVPRAFRSYELYKGLLKKNCEVDVIASKEKRFYKSNFEQDTIDISENKITAPTSNITKIKNELKKYSLFNRLLKLFLYFIGEVPFLTRKKYLSETLKRVDLNQYDRILVISLPFYTAYYTIRYLKKIEWKGRKILDLGDPFYGYQAKRAFYFKKIQKNVLNGFDYISVPILEALSYYYSYVPSTKLKIIPQAFDLNEAKVGEYKQHEITIFGYAGTFYEDIRNPKKLLDYLELLEEPFIFEIYTKKNSNIYYNLLRPYEERMNGKIVIHEPIDRLELIYKFSKMDFLVNLENLSGVQTPSKLIDYSLTKRPILSIQPSDDRLENLNLFIRGDYSNQTLVDINNYDIDNAVKKLLALFGEPEYD